MAVVNDYHAIAEKFREAGHPVTALIIEDLHSKMIAAVMFGLEALEADKRISAETRRDIGDFTFNQRSYR